MNTVDKREEPKKNRGLNEQNYVEIAEEVIEKLSQKKDKRGRTVDMVTTSKIRNLLAMAADIYNQVLTWQSETLSDELNGRIEYLRIRFVYECGRDDSKRKVRNFVEKSEVLEILKEIKKSKKNYLLFSRYMEALVAFHKYYGGKEQ